MKLGANVPIKVHES